MRKTKFLLLAAALMLSTALPANAAEKESITVKTYSEQKGNVLYEEYETVKVDDLKNGTYNLSGASSKVVKVENPNKEDVTAPVLKSISFSKTKITTGKDGKNSTYLYCKISDSGSGVSSATVCFEREDGMVISPSFGPYNYDKTKKAYKVPMQFDDPALAGTYKFKNAFLFDASGNYAEISANDKKCPTAVKNASLKIVEGKVTASAKVESLAFSPTSVKFKSSDVQKKASTAIKLKTKNSDVKKVDLWYRRDNGESGYSLRMYGNIKPSSLNQINHERFIDNSSYNYGKWYIDEITVYFKNGDIKALRRSDGTLPSRFTKKYMTVSGPKENVIADSSLPIVKSIRFKENKLKLAKNKDGIINVILDVADKGSGVSFADVSFYDYEHGKLLGLGTSITTPVKNGKITIPITVSRFLGSGNFVINTVTVRDVAGNTTTYVENKKRYTSTKVRKYLNFTSDMKGMAISVKNTHK